jgi:hypothetical protein
MRRQHKSTEEIAIALNKTPNAIVQKYIKLVPPSGGAGKKRKNTDVDMTEEMKVRLLAAVARAKPSFWATVAHEVGNGITPRQCEMEWNVVIKERK